MLGQTSPSSENQADITAGIVKILVFRDGSTREITGEAGKYWLTGEDRVRKLSGQIAEIREIEVTETEAAEQEKPAPKKKTTRKKKKTEDAEDGEHGE